MEAEDLHFWDDLDIPEGERENLPHLVGTSAIQFIKTSNITIHTLDILKQVYLNVFSCTDFDEEQVELFTIDWFEGVVVNRYVIRRI